MSSDDPFGAYTAQPNLQGDIGNNFYNFTDEDPAAEFLEREKRELGDLTGNGDTNSFDDPYTNQLTNDDHLYANGKN